MRTPNIGTAFYAPGDPPVDPQEMRRFIQDELLKIQTAITALAAGHIDPTFVAPTKPRDGDIRLAGTSGWDPLGTGQKFVGYYGGAWHLLG